MFPSLVVSNLRESALLRPFVLFCNLLPTCICALLRSFAPFCEHLRVSASDRVWNGRVWELQSICSRVFDSKQSLRFQKHCFLLRHFEASTAASTKNLSLNHLAMLDRSRQKETPERPPDATRHPQGDPKGDPRVERPQRSLGDPSRHRGPKGL